MRVFVMDAVFFEFLLGRKRMPGKMTLGIIFIQKLGWLQMLTEHVKFSSALTSACDFKMHFCKQSDQVPHCLPVCKNRFEKFARAFSRRHKQTTFCLQEHSADDINRRHFRMQVFLAF